MASTDNCSSMLAAYCCAPDCNDAGDGLIAKHELRSRARPSLRRTSGDQQIYIYPPGTVLIQTMAASICGSDLFGLGGCAASPRWRRPTDLLTDMPEKCGGSGHEVIGVVRDVVPPPAGDADKNALFIGQKVLAMPLAYLFKVSSMRKVFERETSTRLEEVYLEETGAFCEYFVTHSCVCIPLPTRVPRNEFDFRWYVLAQPLGTILHACQKLGSIANLNIVVVGQGQNGLIMSQMLANMGARRIIALDLLEERLVYSRKNKSTHTVLVAAPMDIHAIRTEVNRITGGQLCDVAIDMVGHQCHTAALCSQLAKDHGRVLLFGLPPAKDEEQISIRYGDLTRNLTYICSHSPEFESFRLALELIERGVVDPSTVFSHVMPFSQFVDAYDKAYNYKDGMIKVLLTFEGVEVG